MNVWLALLVCIQPVEVQLVKFVLSEHIHQIVELQHVLIVNLELLHQQSIQVFVCLVSQVHTLLQGRHRAFPVLQEHFHWKDGVHV